MAALNDEFKKWVNLIKTFELDEIITNLKVCYNLSMYQCKKSIYTCEYT